MSKRQKHTAFLKALVLHGNAEERARLQERINRAERDEQCAWRALWLVSLLAVFSCCGIGYSAVLLPEFFHNSSHFVVRFFCGLGLASLICAVTFLGFWMWCRGVLNRVHEECRRFVMTTLELGGRTTTRPALPRAEKGQRGGSHRSFDVPTAETSPAARSTHQSYAQLFSLRRVS